MVQKVVDIASASSAELQSLMSDVCLKPRCPNNLCDGKCCCRSVD